MLIAGDISFARYMDLEQEKRFLYGEFLDWLKFAPHTIIVGGNHDFYIQHNLKEVRAKLPCEILENSSTEFRGVKIFGTPYSLEYCDWAYQATEKGRQSQPKDMPLLDDIFRGDAESADIIISHGPPHGVGDPGYNIMQLGSRALLGLIERCAPKLVICGHIHEGFGCYTNDKTVVLNCAMMTDSRTPRAHQFVVEFDEEEKRIIGEVMIHGTGLFDNIYPIRYYRF